MILRWFKSLFSRHLVNPVMDALNKGRCPDCGSNEFDFGPHGGVAQNIRCSKCHSEFNVAPFDDGWCGKPMMAERITRK